MYSLQIISKKMYNMYAIEWLLLENYYNLLWMNDFRPQEDYDFSLKWKAHICIEQLGLQSIWFLLTMLDMNSC
jgi:hypothetical protein